MIKLNNQNKLRLSQNNIGDVAKLPRLHPTIVVDDIRAEEQQLVPYQTRSRLSKRSSLTSTLKPYEVNTDRYSQFMDTISSAANHTNSVFVDAELERYKPAAMPSIKTSPANQKPV